MEKSKQDQFLSYYEPIHDRFERFCRARVYGEMDFEDLMNETLLIAYEKFTKQVVKESFLSFLFGISVRVLANSNRKKKVELLSSDHIAEELQDFNDRTESNSEIHLLHKALSLLPENQKEAIILFEITGFSIKEISHLQNSTESAVKQRLKRGRAKLKELLSFSFDQNSKEVNHG
jgi:RNA polymerase sigma-70 factor (ECF subfamily)